MLGEGFDECYAKTPYVTRCGDFAVFELRRIVQRGSEDAARQLPGGADRIAGEFQLVVDHQEVRRLQLALHEVVSMQEA